MASKDLDKPANTNSLIDASAFETVLHCMSFKWGGGVLPYLSMFSGFVCFDSLRQTQQV